MALLPAARALLAAWSSPGPSLPEGAPFLPGTTDLWEARCGLAGQWSCQLDRASAKWLCEPWHKPSFCEPVRSVRWRVQHTCVCKARSGAHRPRRRVLSQKKEMAGLPHGPRASSQPAPYLLKCWRFPPS